MSPIDARPARRRHLLWREAGLVAAVAAAGCGLVPPRRESRVPRVGYLVNGACAGTCGFRDAFLEGLRAIGHVEGRSVVVEARFSEGSAQRLAALAAQLVALPCDVLVGAGTEAGLALKAATTTVPVVAVSSDPVGSGLVTSLARPSGNVTGFSGLSPQLAGKRLALLREIFPALSRVAVLLNPEDPPRVTELAETQAAAAALGLTVRPQGVRRPAADLAGAFGAAADWGAQALIVFSDPLVNNRIADVVRLALEHRLPAVYRLREFVVAGGLMSYGPDSAENYRRAAEYVDRILKGARPGDLPVEQPSTFLLALNLRAAAALGLTIPEAVVDRAGEVIR